MKKLNIFSAKTNDDSSSPATNDYKFLIEMAENLKNSHEIDIKHFVPKKLKSKPELTNFNSVIYYRLIYDKTPEDLFNKLIVECHKIGLHIEAYWANGLIFHAFSSIFANLELKKGNTINVEFYSTDGAKTYTVFIRFREVLSVILNTQKIEYNDFFCNHKDDLFSINRVIHEMELKHDYFYSCADFSVADESKYTLFGIDQNDVVEMNNLKRMLGIETSENDSVDSRVSKRESKQKSKRDWKRASVIAKNFFPYVLLALVLLLVACDLAFNPSWIDRFLYFIDKLKGLGG